MSDLRSQTNSLSAAEKADLLDTVWESLEADSASLTDAQLSEPDYRIARHEQNPSDVIPWPGAPRPAAFAGRGIPHSIPLGILLIHPALSP